MTTFYLVRHGDTGVRNRIIGRMPEIHLSERGRAQAAHLPERFESIPIDAIYSSPLERAVETAKPIASARNLPIRLSDDILEIDYGRWTGKSFDELSEDPEWHLFNSSRSSSQIPGGENIFQVQSRFTGCIKRILHEQSAGSIVLVSHQDPIRAAVMAYVGLHADMFDRFDIGNASVTVIRFIGGSVRLLLLNDVGVLPAEDPA